ncbi:MAG TPA: hypothetical protein VF117_01690, partial [Gammaproteobacteria bacterium]
MLIGMLALLALSHLPPAWMVLPAAALLAVLLGMHRNSRVLLFAVFGFIWAWWYAQHLLAMRLTPAL